MQVVYPPIPGACVRLKWLDLLSGIQEQ